MSRCTEAPAAEEALAILANAEQIHNRDRVEQALDDMAEQITRRLQHKNPLLLCVMIGGMVPAGLLLPRLHFPLQIDYIHATRYLGNTSGGELHWIREPAIPLKGRSLLIVDDVLDEGLTLKAIVQRALADGADSVTTAVLVDKNVPNRAGLKEADVTGLEADNRYLFGYGMDYKTWLRNVDGIYAVDNDGNAP